MKIKHNDVCLDRTYNHDFVAYVDDQMNVTEQCTICNLTFIFDDPKPKWLIEEIEQNKQN